jgi:hypothetical protein
MLEIISATRPYLEALFFLAGVCLVGGIGFTYRQVLLMAKDIRIRNTRASAEKAIEACESYFNNFLPLFNKNYAELRENKVLSYKGPIGDFSIQSLPEKLKAECSKRFSINSWVPALNQLELISAYFISGVADETVGFQVIGRTFCDSVERKYDIVALSRHEKAYAYWSNIVALYQLWQPRLQKAEMNLEKINLEMQMSSINNKQLKPIGVAD